MKCSIYYITFGTLPLFLKCQQRLYRRQQDPRFNELLLNTGLLRNICSSHVWKLLKIKNKDILFQTLLKK